MERALQVLMDGLIDYAGLFPPASLGMDDAVRAYAGYRRSPEAAWLGRFVLPAARLPEFARALAAVPGEGSRGLLAGGGPWRLSVLAGPDLAGDLAALAAFAAFADGARGADGKQGAMVDSVEAKAETPEALQALLAALSAGRARGALPAGAAIFVEIPLQADPAPFLPLLARAGARAKIRTGGVTPGAIPPGPLVARFLAACARSRVPFKATAGLHHPVRALHPLTYAPDAPRDVMHGFLNLFLAAALALRGEDGALLADVLAETDPGAFRFAGDTAAWRDLRLSGAELASARRAFALSFGSCSFDEPRADLKEIRLA